MDNLEQLVRNLGRETAERPWVEFKHNNYDPDMIGRSVSALANGATLRDKAHAYMVWGVENGTHLIVGTRHDLQSIRVGSEELESWLRHQLSANADFEFDSCQIEGKRVGVLSITKSVQRPVAFEKTPYIRVGSYTKPLRDVPTLEARLWDKLRAVPFETTPAKTDLELPAALATIDFGKYYDLLEKNQPSDFSGVSHDLLEEGVLILQDNGLFSVSNLGAILLAKRLSDFPGLARKALRIVQYRGDNRVERIREFPDPPEAGKGYAISLSQSLDFIEAVLPSREDIEGATRIRRTPYPMIALREAIANALIHQDFSVTEAGPTVEIFDRRLEITNPGAPLIDIDRLIDNPPKSRNERIASLMRRFRLCEEMGTGWDKIVISCELGRLPAPRMSVYDDAGATRVTIETQRPFSDYSSDDRLHACYLHACLRFVQQNQATNASLRERFGLPETSSGMISRVIKEAVRRHLIKPINPDTAPRYMKYIPYWA